MQVQKNDTKKPEPVKDDWDRVLDSYQEYLNEKRLKEVIGFRVSKNQKAKIIKKFGSPSGVRNVVLEEAGLEPIEIVETADVVEVD